MRDEEPTSPYALLKEKQKKIFRKEDPKTVKAIEKIFRDIDVTSGAGDLTHETIDRFSTIILAQLFVASIIDLVLDPHCQKPSSGPSGMERSWMKSHLMQR